MRYQPLLFLSICVWIISIPAVAQVVSESNNNPNEVSVAVNHQNEAQVLVVSNIANLYQSADSGKNWKEKKMESSLGVAGDPTLFCDEQGVFYYAHLSKTPGKARPDYYDRMVVQRSFDGGQTWNDGVGVGFNGGKMQDKEWLAGDVHSGSPFYGNIYLSWTEFDVYGSADTNHRSRIRFAVSMDKGQSFSEPAVVSDETGDCKDGDNTMEGATVACGPNGEIYITWAGKGKIWFDVSYDGGKTFGVDRVLADLYEGWTLDIPGIYRSNGMPYIACNPNTGEVWICYADRKPGSSSQVFLLRTRAELDVWSSYVPKHDGQSDAFFPNLVVNPNTGTVAVVYYQSVGKDQLQVKVYQLSASHAPSHTIISEPFSKPGRKIFFGDYIDIDYFGEGFIATWTSIEKKKRFGRRAKNRLVIRVKKVG
ncbi:MAG: sialidase family protein [Bacteroidia bacterium]